MSEDPGDLYATHFAAEKLEQGVSSVLIAHRLTLSGAEAVGTTPWHRDSSMALYSVRVRTGDDEITLPVSDWGSRADEVWPFLREWIRERIHLGGTKLKSSSRRRDPYWTDAWRRAHPWG